MKDRTREAVFNLVGPAVRNKLVIDLFSGTGAMGLEALSRGADRAILIERRVPATKLIQRNVQALGLDAEVSIVNADAFWWAAQHSPPDDPPWLVFFCPPYEFFVSRRTDMLQLVGHFAHRAPGGSLFVVEADQRFDPRELPAAASWDHRVYTPAIVAVGEKPRPRE
jgi:16S rRNA (guanine966-N2)-methyltransferase